MADPSRGVGANARAAFLGLALLLGGASPAFAEEIGIHRAQGELYVDFRLEQVLEEGVLESLRSGLPSRVRHRVQIWQQRSTLWDRQVIESRRHFRIVYDLIDETYDLFDDRGLLETNLELFELEPRLAEMPPEPVCSLDELEEGDRYYALVEIVVEPLSVEEVRDLERWLQGSLRENDGGALQQLPSQLLGLFKSQVGLGERRHEVRSATFRPAELSRLEE